MAAPQCPPCCSDSTRGCSSAVCPRSWRASCRAWTSESYQTGSSHSPAANMLRGLFASLHAETNSTQMQGYLQHRLNLFYKYWQEMCCLAAIFSGKFWLCSSHPAVLGFFAFRSKRWQGWHTCRVVVCASASLWRWQQPFFSFFFIDGAFFCYLSFSFPFFSREGKNILHGQKSMWIAKSQQHVLYFKQWRGVYRFVPGSVAFRTSWMLVCMETMLLGLGFCCISGIGQRLVWAFSSRLSGLRERGKFVFQHDVGKYLVSCWVSVE